MNYYDRTVMGAFLVKSKNGSLESEIDALTYLSQPLMTILLRKIEIEAEKKLAVACKLIGSTFGRDNVNWICTKNILMLKNWLRVSSSSFSDKKVISHLAKYGGFRDEQCIIDILMAALQSPLPNVRNHILSILWDEQFAGEQAGPKGTLTVELLNSL